jgi:hypothetical protein
MRLIAFLLVFACDPPPATPAPSDDPLAPNSLPPTELLAPLAPIVAAPATNPEITPAPALPGVWNDLDIPADDGERDTRPDQLTVKYRSGEAAPRAIAWESALEGAGFAAAGQLDSDGQITRLYARDGRQVVLGVLASDGTVTVTLTDLGRP